MSVAARPLRGVAASLSYLPRSLPPFRFDQRRAQDAASQLEQLTNRKRDLDAKVANEDKNIADADTAIASLCREVAEGSVELELAAD